MINTNNLNTSDIHYYTNEMIKTSIRSSYKKAYRMKHIGNIGSYNNFMVEVDFFKAFYLERGLIFTNRMIPKNKWK